MLKNKRVKRGIAVVLCLCGLNTQIRTNAAEPISSTLEGRANNDAKLQWQRDMQAMDSQRTAAFAAGGLGLVAGTVLFVAGISDKNSARDADGCRSSGNNITCGNQQQADNAQSKLDDGNKKIVLGALVAGAGLFFCVLGVNRGNRLQEMKVDGMRRHFVWDIELKKNGAPTLLARLFF